MDALRGLAVFLLDSGHFGICPEAVRCGDRIVVAESWDTCLVVRRVVVNYASESGGAVAYDQFVEYASMDGLCDLGHRDDEYIRQIRDMEEEEIRLI